MTAARDDRALDRALTAWLDASGPHDIRPAAVDAAIARARSLPQRSRLRVRLLGPRPWPARRGELDHRLRLAAVVALLAALVAGLLAVGGPRPTGPLPTAAPTLVPASAEPSLPATPGPVPSASASTGGPAGPCAAMVQLLQVYGTDDATVTPPATWTRTAGATDILTPTLGADGEVRIGRLDASSGIAVPVEAGGSVERVFPSIELPVHPLSRIVPSPDGRAVAVEEGDLGAAGCGDPLVVFADGGRSRPFPAAAFQLVTDLAWAPDGSALYAVRRSTLDADGDPLPLDDWSGLRVEGPGTVLRWDTATGEVTTLDGDCGTCSDLAVSPDGRRLAAAGGDGTLRVHDDDGWTSIAMPDPGSPVPWGVVGWRDADHVATSDLTVVGLDGSVVTIPAPCCHGTGFGGPTSADGTRMAGLALSADFVAHEVRVLDLRDGSVATIWRTEDPAGCSAFTPGSSGRAECEAAVRPTPGPIPLSGYAEVVAWSPGEEALLIAERAVDSTRMQLVVLPLDGGDPVGQSAIEAPDLSAEYGFPNQGTSIVWLRGGD